MCPIQSAPDQTSAHSSKRVAPKLSSESQPRNLTFQFLDHSDPDRSTVVRRKAREWVNKSKDDAEKSAERARERTGTQTKHVQRNWIYTTRESRYVRETIMELRRFDAFGILPGTRKDCYHIIQYCESRLGFSALWR